MFIRKTIKKDPLSGKSYSSYYLVESTHTDKGPRQRVLLYMGSEIGLPEGDLTLLSQRIEDIINEQQSFAPYSQECQATV